MTTVGFGDFIPTKRDSKSFTIFFAIAGVCVIAVGLQQITSFLERKREIFMAAAKKRIIQVLYIHILYEDNIIVKEREIQLVFFFSL